MRYVLLTALLLLTGCGEPTPADLVAALESAGVPCEKRREVGDHTIGCWMDRGRYVVAVLPTGPLEYYVALDMDNGGRGPWIIGDGWVITVVNGHGIEATMQAALGGRIIRDGDDLRAV